MFTLKGGAAPLDTKVARNVDWTLVVLATGMGLFGLLALHEAAGDWAAVRQQAIWLVVGLAVMAVVAWTDYHFWARWAKAIYVADFLLLAGTLVIGHRALGAQRWIGFGPFHLQPSELAKVAMIVALAAFVAPRFGRLGRLRDAIVPTLLVVPPALLVMLQPDLGTSIAFIAILAGVLFMGGLSGWKIAGVGILAIVCAVGLIYAHYRWHVPVPLDAYQLQRLVVFTNPQSDPLGSGFHILQSEIAIGSGQLYGKGLAITAANSLTYLPEASNDFIFAVVAQRLGFVGAGALLVAFFLLLARGMRVAAKARDPFGACLAAGVIAMLAFHAFINTGMTMGMMPVTGVPLPFTSAGGSALLADYAGIGLLLSIHMRRKKIQF
ncbi:MAG TPA: rod shape-determining protein RodA [Bacillota bacterium]|nr:rod shape-determining protein RodA [Bacillota bacterium]